VFQAQGILLVAGNFFDKEKTTTAFSICEGLKEKNNQGLCLMDSKPRMWLTSGPLKFLQRAVLKKRAASASLGYKQERGPLKKGAFYLARIAYNQHKDEIQTVIAKLKDIERKPSVAKKLIDVASNLGLKGFDRARPVFEETIKDYLIKDGGNEDAALKNTEFARLIDERSIKK